MLQNILVMRSNLPEEITLQPATLYFHQLFQDSSFFTMMEMLVYFTGLFSVDDRTQIIKYIFNLKDLFTFRGNYKIYKGI
jgi:hypothetical protein